MIGRVEVVTDPNAIARMRAHHVTSFVRAREECIGEARRLAPVLKTGVRGIGSGSVQGGLRASITDDGPPRISGGTITGRFGSGLPYAMMREKGGTIAPVRRRALSWLDPQTGMRIVLGPTIKRTHASIDKTTGLKTLFVRKASVTQQGKPYIEPAGNKFPGFFTDHLRSGGW